MSNQVVPVAVVIPALSSRRVTAGSNGMATALATVRAASFLGAALLIGAGVASGVTGLVGIATKKK